MKRQTADLLIALLLAITPAVCMAEPSDCFQDLKRMAAKAGGLFGAARPRLGADWVESRRGLFGFTVSRRLVPVSEPREQAGRDQFPVRQHLVFDFQAVVAQQAHPFKQACQFDKGVAQVRIGEHVPLVFLKAG